MEKISLSIGLITKNEEVCLEKCLQSLLPILKNIPSELVIVDTGSIDQTKNIARKYTDKVFDFKWCDNFAKARNFVLDHCYGEWFMQIDADESFEKTDSIIDFFRSGECDHYNDASYIVRNYHSLSGESYTDYYLCRMFRRRPGRIYQGSIHESVAQIGPVKYFDEHVNHYGYVNSFSDEKSKRKNRRNLPLLLKELENNPQDSRLLYQAVQEYSGLGEIKKTEELCERIIYGKKINKNDLFVIYATNKIIDIAIAKGNFQKAVEIGEYFIGLKMAIMPEQLNILDKMSSVFATLDEKEKAEHYYKEYFYVRDLFQKRIENGESGIVSRSDSFKAEIYENKIYQYVKYLQENEKYKRSLEYLLKTRGGLGKKGINEVIGFWIKALEHTNDMEYVYEYYIRAQSGENKYLRMAREILMGIWEKRPDLGEKVGSYFKGNEGDECLMVQETLMMERSKEKGLTKQLELLCQTIGIESYYQKLIFIAMENEVAIDSYLQRATGTELLELAEDIYNKNPKMREYLLTEKLKFAGENGSLSLARFYVKLEEKLLFDVNLTYSQMDQVFRNYIRHFYYIVEKIYQPILLNTENCNLLPDKDCFIVLCKRAIDKKEEGDWKNYLAYLKKAIKYNPPLTEKIKLLMKEFRQTLEEQEEEKQKAKREFDEYGKKIKVAILNLIKAGRFKDAMDIIEEYEKINPADRDIPKLKDKLEMFS